MNFQEQFHSCIGIVRVNGNRRNSMVLMKGGSL
jgi:hypothetical protein